METADRADIEIQMEVRVRIDRHGVAELLSSRPYIKTSLSRQWRLGEGMPEPWTEGGAAIIDWRHARNGREMTERASKVALQMGDALTEQATQVVNAWNAIHPGGYAPEDLQEKYDEAFGR